MYRWCTDHLQIIPTHYDLDVSGQIYRSTYDLCDIPHVAGWEPYNLHDVLGHVSL